MTENESENETKRMMTSVLTVYTPRTWISDSVIITILLYVTKASLERKRCKKRQTKLVKYSKQEKQKRFHVNMYNNFYFALIQEI